MALTITCLIQDGGALESKTLKGKNKYLCTDVCTGVGKKTPEGLHDYVVKKFKKRVRTNFCKQNSTLHIFHRQPEINHLNREK